MDVRRVALVFLIGGAHVTIYAVVCFLVMDFNVVGLCCLMSGDYRGRYLVYGHDRGRC